MRVGYLLIWSILHLLKRLSYQQNKFNVYKCVKSGRFSVEYLKLWC